MILAVENQVGADPVIGSEFKYLGESGCYCGLIVIYAHLRHDAYAVYGLRQHVILEFAVVKQSVKVDDGIQALAVTSGKQQSE